MVDGRQAVVRNGHLPEREITTALGPVPVKVPKVRDRSGSGVKFNSALVPPYVRKSRTVTATVPWLYLHGVSSGHMQEAVGVVAESLDRQSQNDFESLPIAEARGAEAVQIRLGRPAARRRPCCARPCSNRIRSFC
jgi:hypothetical protein